MINYKIHRIFKSIQGEGIDMGCMAIFVRMAGCNLSCPFCDTDYERRFEMNNKALFEAIEDISDHGSVPYVIFTGGEPLLQDIYPVVENLKEKLYTVGLETNGLIAPVGGMFDRISFSPKTPRVTISLHDCDSLKILYPYLPNVTPYDFKHFPAKWRGIQPIDEVGAGNNNLVGALREVEALGLQWRLSPQVHKLLNLQ